MVYHSIRPHRALTPLPDTPANLSEQRDNEIAWSQLLVTGILPFVLPPEDLENPCLHVLVSEVVSEMIVHNAICGKGSEAWVILEGVTKLIHSLLPSSPIGKSPADDTLANTNRLEQFGLLSSAEGPQRNDLQDAQRGQQNMITHMFWTTLNLLSIAWLLLRTLAISLMHESSIPARSFRGGMKQTSDKVSVTAVDAQAQPSPHEALFDQHADPRPVVSMRAWSCISKLTLLEYRMPWTFGFLSLLHWLSLQGPGKLCRTNGALDR